MNLPLKDCYGHKYHVAHPSIQCRADAEGAEVFVVEYEHDNGCYDHDADWVEDLIGLRILVLSHSQEGADGLIVSGFLYDFVSRHF